MKRRHFGIGLAGSLIYTGCSRKSEVTLTARGTAFGTEVAVTLPESDAEFFDAVFEEIARLEAIFTLFDPQSPLRQLNAAGRLSNPPPELVEVLKICDRVHRLTEGAFDPTVQPLWELYEGHFAKAPTDTEGPASEAIAAARSRIGWDKLSVSAEEIRFAEPRMGLTLNGIAPGYTADRIVALLKSKGVKHALIDTGEFRALGSQLDGSPWRVEIRAGDSIAGHADLVDRALATSAGNATAFDLVQQFHHLFHPDRDRFQPAMRTVSVEAPEAALADALATAGGVMESADLEAVATTMPDVKVRIFDHGS